jgi:hypothetical protein
MRRSFLLSTFQFRWVLLSCHVMSCLALSCPVLFFPVLSLSLSCLFLSCPVLSCPVLSCLVSSPSHLILYCIALSCLALPCLVLSGRIYRCPLFWIFLTCLVRQVLGSVRFPRRHPHPPHPASSKRPRSWMQSSVSPQDGTRQDRTREHQNITKTRLD